MVSSRFVLLVAASAIVSLSTPAFAVDIPSASMQTVHSSVFVTHLADLSLDDGSKAFVGSDHKLYLLGAGGATKIAPAGHYHLADGGCMQVDVNGVVDPGLFQGSRFVVPATQTQHAL